MEQNIAIVSVDALLMKKIVDKYNLSKVQIDSGEIYVGSRKSDEGDTERLICLHVNMESKLEDSLNELGKNYDLHKVVSIGFAESSPNSDIKSGDIVIPNTFYSLANGEESEPLFLEYAVGENLDLQKFGLILSGLCISVGEGFSEDVNDELSMELGEYILDRDAYEVVSFFSKKEMLDKCVVVKGITAQNMGDIDDAAQHLIAIIDIVV